MSEKIWEGFLFSVSLIPAAFITIEYYVRRAPTILKIIQEEEDQKAKQKAKIFKEKLEKNFAEAYPKKKEKS